MAKATSTEQWKDVAFGFKYTNDYVLQVSNKGNLRAFNKFSAGEPLQGTTVNGYRIIRLKLYKPKDKKTIKDLKTKHIAIVTLRDRIKKWKLEVPQKNKKQLNEGKEKLKIMSDILRKERQKDIHLRTIHYHSLIHRLVAECFVKPKSPQHTVVGHKDFNKLNNAASNLA